jgi:hypothetical protein
LKIIAQNIKHGRYRVLDEVERDLLLMVKNAKTFNEPKSLIYKVFTFNEPKLLIYKVFTFNEPKSLIYKVFYILLIEILVNLEKIMKT